MISFPMIMTQVSLDRISQRGFSNEDHPVERLLFYGPYESLTMCVQIRTPRGQHHRLHPVAPQVLVECICEFAVAIVDEIAFVEKKAINRYR